MHSARFTCHTLNQHANGHAGGESVRVDDHVGLHAALGERHVNGRPLLRANTLLSMPRGEFVSDDRGTGDAQCDVDFL